MVNEMWLKSGGFWTPIGALLVFGVAYAYFIRWAKRKGYLEGYTAYAVVLGCVVTVAGAAVAMLWSGLISGDQFAPVLVALMLSYIASGTPMIVGDMVEHLEARRNEQDSILEASDAQT